jgi:hypothetical protein
VRAASSAPGSSGDTSPVHILGISGSLRKGSCNNGEEGSGASALLVVQAHIICSSARWVAPNHFQKMCTALATLADPMHACMHVAGMLRAAAKRLPPNVTLEIADLSQLPLYNVSTGSSGSTEHWWWCRVAVRATFRAQHPPLSWLLQALHCICTEQGNLQKSRREKSSMHHPYSQHWLSSFCSSAALSCCVAPGCRMTCGRGLTRRMMTQRCRPLCASSGSRSVCRLMWGWGAEVIVVSWLHQP